MPTCIDLKARFGARYRITHDQAHAAEYGENSRVYDPWLAMIPCRHGHVYPHGGELLAASTDRRGAISKRLSILPGVRLLQDGDDGVNVVFHIKDFDAVAAILKPRRRRQLTPEQKAERTERLRQYRFSPASQNDSGDRRRDAVA